MGATETVTGCKVQTARPEAVVLANLAIAMVIAMEIARSFMTVTFETLQQVFPAGLAWIAGSPAPPRVAG
ncbi:MAG: hypothetical protein ABI178_14955, partial [Rhodanobacter sp.]